MRTLSLILVSALFCSQSYALSCDSKPIDAAIELAKVNGISLGGTYTKKTAVSEQVDVFTITGRDYDSGTVHQYKVKRYGSEDSCVITSVTQLK